MGSPLSENSFLNLLYPKSFIHFAKSKALKIHNKNQPRTYAYLQSYTTSSPHRFITLPNNLSSHSIINNLNKLNIKTTSLPSKTIRVLAHSSPQRNIFSDASVYCIPCKNCKLKYIGETSQNFHIIWKNTKETYDTFLNLTTTLIAILQRCSFTFITKD